MIIKAPENQEEFEKYYRVRWEMLRKPWNKPKGSEIDGQENDCIHAMALIEEEVAGVGRLQFNTPSECQIRYMAVPEKFQGQDIGTAVLKYLEEKAKENNCNYLILQARDLAVPFYLKNGYEVREKTFVLFDNIQHFLMEKKLG